MRRIVLPLAAALAVTAAVPASADHDKGGKKQYTLDPPVTKLSKKQALSFFVQDLEAREGGQVDLGKARKAKCKMKKKSATCTYRVQLPDFGLGVKSFWCVKKGKLKLTFGGAVVTINQKAKDC